MKKKLTFQQYIYGTSTDTDLTQSINPATQQQGELNDSREDSSSNASDFVPLTSRCDKAAQRSCSAQEYFKRKLNARHSGNLPAISR